MATPKQLALRLKYAKISINSITRKLNSAKSKAKALEADLKKVKAAEKKKSPAKSSARKKVSAPRRGCRM